MVRRLALQLVESFGMAACHPLQVREQARHVQGETLAEVGNGKGRWRLLDRLARQLHVMRLPRLPETCSGEDHLQLVLQSGEATLDIGDVPLDDELCSPLAHP